jgi:hypothetical protein
MNGNSAAFAFIGDEVYGEGVDVNYHRVIHYLFLNHSLRPRLKPSKVPSKHALPGMEKRS